MASARPETLTGDTVRVSGVDGLTKPPYLFVSTYVDLHHSSTDQDAASDFRMQGNTMKDCIRAHAPYLSHLLKMDNLPQFCKHVSGNVLHAILAQ